ncbi:MAG: SCO family protein [Phycisphaerales bacterium]
MHMRARSIMTLACSAAAAWTVTLTAVAQLQSDDVPRELEGVDVIEHLDAPLPLDATFTDSTGATVRLGDFFKADRPVIVTLNYYNCPMLCTLQLNGLVQGLRDVEFVPGETFQIVTISVDPSEGSSLAAGKKSTYVNAYRSEAEAGWAFLTGTQENITAVAQAFGYGYRWNEKRQEWAHPAVIFVATPDGRISRYLYGQVYATKNLRLALLEASEGRIGSTVDRFLMWCFHYNDETGQYTPAVMNITRLLGGVMVIGLGIALLTLWVRDHRKQLADAAAARAAFGSQVQ